jgi:light-harvesting complex 1 alpha chain
MHRPPIEVRTVAFIYTLLGIVMALVIHFVVLSSPRYNWLSLIGG